MVHFSSLSFYLNSVIKARCGLECGGNYILDVNTFGKGAGSWVGTIAHYAPLHSVPLAQSWGGGLSPGGGLRVEGEVDARAESNPAGSLLWSPVWPLPRLAVSALDLLGDIRL